MYLNIVIGVLILIISLKFIDCYFINIDVYVEECFFDKVIFGIKMSFMFEVVEGGFFDIDVKVRFFFYNFFKYWVWIVICVIYVFDIFIIFFE